MHRVIDATAYFAPLFEGIPVSYLYAQISSSDFSDLFRRYGRETQFSYRAKIALFGYLNDLALGVSEPIEIDCIALCCEWSEYASVTEAAVACGCVAEEPDNETDDEEIDGEKEMLEYLIDRTQVIEFAGGILVQDF